MDRKAKMRKRLRNQGMKPLEVWLHEDLLAVIDNMKNAENQSRDSVIRTLLESSITAERQFAERRQAMS